MHVESEREQSENEFFLLPHTVPSSNLHGRFQTDLQYKLHKHINLAGRTTSGMEGAAKHLFFTSILHGQETQVLSNSEL